ncbi:MAG: phage integrase SAM-like domain and Arm DNA-binding domain-containing protein [Fibrobacterota bacterium]|nr:phage integrase SAM-like domain and Arm DNA-binding domain-containing protein [Fibrobacterota bacterium]
MAVYIRKRKLKSGAYRVYLDLYHNGKRWTEFPENLIFTKDSKRETLDLAEKLAARRQLELAHNETGFSPSHKRKSNFLVLFLEVVSKRGPQSQGSWKSVHEYLKEFTGGRVPFSAIDHNWMEKFQSFLLQKVGQNTTNLYLGLIKTALKEAVKQKIIAQNPIDLYGFSKPTETSKIYLVGDEIVSGHLKIDHLRALQNRPPQRDEIYAT